MLQNKTRINKPKQIQTQAESLQIDKTPAN